MIILRAIRHIIDIILRHTLTPYAILSACRRRHDADAAAATPSLIFCHAADRLFDAVTPPSHHLHRHYCHAALR